MGATGGDASGAPGAGHRFQTTRWTEILALREADDEERRDILGGILARYWKPVYGYLCRSGHRHDAAMDLTQGFIAEVVIGRSLVDRADRSRGRFRTFLLTALDRYVRGEFRASRAKKRSPGTPLVSLDGLDVNGLPEVDSGDTPEQAFQHQWASTLIDGVLSEVADACEQNGLTPHWKCFEARVLDPIRNDSKPRPLPDVCAELGIPDEAKASAMVITVKRRFEATLRRHVRVFVDSDDAIDQEIGEILEILSTHRAR